MQLCVVSRPVGLLVGIVEEEFQRESNTENQVRVLHLGIEGQPETWVLPASSVHFIRGDSREAIQATYTEWIEKHLCQLVQHSDLYLSSVGHSNA